MKIILLMILIALFSVLPATAQDLGMVGDDDNDSITVFDADTGQVWGTIALPTTGFAVGDCAVTPDQSLGFVTDWYMNVHVIDLTQRPPVLAGGINPITVNSIGVDLEITPDGKFLLVSTGRCWGGSLPISIIDIATRTVINDFQGSNIDYNSLDIDENGNVLTYSYNMGSPVLSVFSLDHNGQMWLVDGFGIGLDYSNVRFAPGGASFVGLDDPNNIIDSFTAPPITLVGSVDMTASGGTRALSCAFRPLGDAVFVRQNGAPGVIDAYAFNPTLGQIGLVPLFTIENIFNQTPFLGRDTIAVDRHGRAVYVPQPGGIELYDADPLGSGQFLGHIPAPLVDPSGIAFSRWPAPMTPMGELDAINLSVADVFNGGATNDRVYGKGTMELAPGAEPFDPWLDNVYVCLNDMHFVIPTGSFVEHNYYGIKWWNFNGPVDGGNVSMQISFNFSTNWQIRTAGFDTSSAVSGPPLLKISIGDNEGEFPFEWTQQYNYGAATYARYRKY